ncbi:cation channel sperm-associated protein 3 [Pelecanus crispus]|uniref:cation channel sperm-associated protein 3 n=1 Tax=Pelecanus crispus TaxID=36300 RepID=UPI003F5D1BFC
MPCKQLRVRSSREIDTSEMPECIARMAPPAQLPAPEKRDTADGGLKYLDNPSQNSLLLADAFFLTVYTTELLLKLYADPIAYWKSGHNTLDAAILLIAFLSRVLPVDTAPRTHPEGTTKGLQTPRTLKLLKYSRGTRVFTETLGQTVQTVTYALILLFLLMFVFDILGHGWYGDPKTGDIENWGSLKAALFTLFSLVDGWTDLQREMDHYGFTSSHMFIVVFVLLGNFIFFNMLIALAITKTQGLTQKYEQDCKAAKAAAVWAKKQKILKKQGNKVSNQVTLEQQITKLTQGEDFDELLDGIKKTSRLSSIIIMEGFCFTMPFIDLYLPLLDLQDDTSNR